MGHVPPEGPVRSRDSPTGRGTPCRRPDPRDSYPPAPGSLSLRIPSNVDGLLGVETPDRQINMRDPDHCPQAFRDGIKLPMPEQAADKRRHFVLCHCQGD
jgi:hypothetical protein